MVGDCTKKNLNGNIFVHYYMSWKSCFDFKACGLSKKKKRAASFPTAAAPHSSQLLADNSWAACFTAVSLAWAFSAGLQPGFSTVKEKKGKMFLNYNFMIIVAPNDWYNRSSAFSSYCLYCAFQKYSCNLWTFAGFHMFQPQTIIFLWRGLLESILKPKEEIRQVRDNVKILKAWLDATF